MVAVGWDLGDFGVPGGLLDSAVSLAMVADGVGSTTATLYSPNFLLTNEKPLNSAWLTAERACDGIGVKLGVIRVKSESKLAVSYTSRCKQNIVINYVCYALAANVLDDR